jgi:hypothetical protein
MGSRWRAWRCFVGSLCEEMAMIDILLLGIPSLYVHACSRVSCLPYDCTTPFDPGREGMGLLLEVEGDDTAMTVGN